jgi:hypothetical protein
MSLKYESLPWKDESAASTRLPFASMDRLKSAGGEVEPAVSDLNLKVYGNHMRMSELKHIAESIGAELIELPRGQKHQKEDEEEDVEVVKEHA